jgi:rSAM/selenodomain-associated transferase 1
MTTQLGIFAKHWQPGAVKTRLAASIGEKTAAALHRCFVQTLLNRFQHVADRQALWFTPADSAEEFRQLDLGRWTLEPQASGDLGARVKHYFSSALSASDSLRPLRTVLIGSDSPDLPLEYVDEAFDKLRSFPVVLGPATDGGYYLIGASQTVPPIFDNIPWSTPEVWTQTISRLTAAQIPYHVLPKWYDVDDFTGLRRLETSLPTGDALRVKISSLLTSDL